MKKFILGEDIQRLDGTKVFTVEEIIDEIYGNPITKIVFRGTQKQCKIEKAIKELDLKQDEIDSISVGNMDKICNMAKVDMLDLMKYLRYERKSE